jgi:hypothetical protein
MSGREDSGGQRAFMALAAVILGGLLFAAGVLVGRRMALGESGAPADTLGRIDQRDRQPLPPVDGSKLSFPGLLSGGSGREQERLKPKPAPDTGHDPDAIPDGGAEPPPSGDPGGPEPQRESIQALASSYCLQVASFRERGQAQTLVDKLQAKGYPEVRLLEGVTGSKGTFFRVRVGKLLEHGPAEDLARRLLEEEKLKALVIKEE